MSPASWSVVARFILGMRRSEQARRAAMGLDCDFVVEPVPRLPEVDSRSTWQRGHDVRVARATVARAAARPRAMRAS